MIFSMQFKGNGIMTMKIELTEVERHALLAMLGPKQSVEWKLHGHGKTRNWSPEELYQKVLLAKEEKSCTCV